MGDPVLAAVLREPGGKLSVEEIELPDPGPGQVRVRLAATGVCHSDLSLSSGTLDAPMPVVLGHEGAGTIVSVGTGVRGLTEGDPVVLNWAPACRECWHCAHGEPYLCDEGQRGWTRPYARLADGTAVHAGLGAAAFATETVVQDNACVRLPRDIPLADAAMLGCAALTGVGAVLRTARVHAGESVVVIGIGGVGLSAVQAARIAGAAQIIAVDPAEEKADLARRLGATDVLTPGRDLTKRIRALTDGRGADHAIECVGRAETMRAAWSALRRGGRATVVGLGSADDKFELSAMEIALTGKTLVGCMYGSSDPSIDVPHLLDHYRAGRLDLTALVSREIGLADVDTAFAEMRIGNGARSLIRFDT